MGNRKSRPSTGTITPTQHLNYTKTLNLQSSLSRGKSANAYSMRRRLKNKVTFSNQDQIYFFKKSDHLSKTNNALITVSQKRASKLR